MESHISSALLNNYSFPYFLNHSAERASVG